MADWSMLNQNVNGGIGAVGDIGAQNLAAKNALGMALMKAKMEADMKAQMEAQLYQKTLEQSMGAMQSNPEMFGLGGGMPQLQPMQPQVQPPMPAGGQSFNPVAPQAQQQKPTIPRNLVEIDMATGKLKNVPNPDYEQAMAVEKAKQIEANKPYSPDEIRVKSKELLIPQIDSLIKLLENENVYGEGEMFGNAIPFGASRISSFGEKGPFNAFKKGLTAGPGREAGLLLQDIKRVMFQEGGAALTDTEISILAGKLNPAYKNEEQWIKDLKGVREEIIFKARMLRPAPNEVQVNQPVPEQQNQPQEGSYQNLWN